MLALVCIKLDSELTKFTVVKFNCDLLNLNLKFFSIKIQLAIQPVQVLATGMKIQWWPQISFSAFTRAQSTERIYTIAIKIGGWECAAWHNQQNENSLMDRMGFVSLFIILLYFNINVEFFKVHTFLSHRLNKISHLTIFTSANQTELQRIYLMISSWDQERTESSELTTIVSIKSLIFFYYLFKTLWRYFRTDR